MPRLSSQSLWWCAATAAIFVVTAATAKPARVANFVLSHVAAKRSLEALASSPPSLSSAVHLSFDFDDFHFDEYLELLGSADVGYPVKHIGANGVHLASADAAHDGVPVRTYKSLETGSVLTLLNDDASQLDGVFVKEGRHFHVMNQDDGEGLTVEDVENAEDDGSRCPGPIKVGSPAVSVDSAHADDDSTRRRLRQTLDRTAADAAAAAVKRLHRVHSNPFAQHDEHRDGSGTRQLEVARWTGCGIQVSETLSYRIGFIVDFSLYTYLQNRGIDPTNFVDQVVSESNLVYEKQLGIRLIVGELIIISASNSGLDFDKCNIDIFDQLDAFRAYVRANTSRQGQWHLLTNCHPAPGIVGLAYVDVLCYGWGGWNTGISSRTRDTWLIVAHELGHNFNADHSFEDGQGSTGGIMDYGDGYYKGEYQFNSKYRKGEVCGAVKQVLNAGNCPAFSSLIAATPTFAPTPSPVPPTNAPTMSPTDTPTSPTPSPTRGQGQICAQMNRVRAQRQRQRRCVAQDFCNYNKFRKRCNLRVTSTPTAPTLAPSNSPTPPPTAPTGSPTLSAEQQCLGVNKRRNVKQRRRFCLRNPSCFFEKNRRCKLRATGAPTSGA